MSLCVLGGSDGGVSSVETATRGSATAELIDGRPGTPSTAGRRTTSLFDRIAWRDALLVWGIQRLVLQALAYLGYWLFKPIPITQGTSFGEQSWRVWAQWDAHTYGTIAREGYAQLFEAAFSPMMPALEHVLALLTGANADAIGPFIASGAYLGAFGLIRVLVERELGRSAARRTLVYLAVFPMALFLAAGYAESLFLLFSAGAFLALRQQHWITAGMLAALATLTRSVGILLVAPIAIECVTQLRAARSQSALREKWGNLARMALALALPAAALGGVTLYLDHQYGTTNGMAQAEAQGWGRYLSWPWDGVLRASSAFFHDPLAYQVHAGFDLAILLLFVVLSIAAVTRLAPAFAAYAVASCILVVEVPIHATPAHPWDWLALSSGARFMLMVFPVFMVLALWGRNRMVHLTIVAISGLLLVIMMLAFTAGGFIG
jgi:hypothetical protein